jgi:hypothetical protein
VVARHETRVIRDGTLRRAITDPRCAISNQPLEIASASSFCLSLELQRLLVRLAGGLRDNLKVTIHKATPVPPVASDKSLRSHMLTQVVRTVLIKEVWLSRLVVQRTTRRSQPLNFNEKKSLLRRGENTSRRTLESTIFEQ